MKPCQPKIAAGLESTDDFAGILASALAGEEDIANLLFQNVLSPGADAHKMEFSGVEFHRCRLNGSLFDKASFVDVRFCDCDLTECSFSDAYFSRCEFISCKWVGGNLTGATLRQSRAERCSFQYANFDGASIGGTALNECDFTGAVLANAALQDLLQRDNRWIGTNFFHTPLKGMDFSKDTVDGWMLSEGLGELKGAVFSPYQAVDLALLLGIRIKSNESSALI